MRIFQTGILRAAALALVLLGSLVNTRVGWADDFTISAAISLKGALEKAQPELEKAAGMAVKFNFGASGTLGTQIARGAPVDVFISADKANVEKLNTQGLVAADSATVVASGELVLVVPAASKKLESLADLSTAKLTKLAIGEPKIVPAGQYAKQTLEKMKLYAELDKAGKLVTGENVAQVLAYVERGEVDAGLVYRTDAKVSAKVRVVEAAPDDAHDPIVYVMATVKNSTHADAASAVRKAILDKSVQDILGSFGFKAPPVTATTPVKN